MTNFIYGKNPVIEALLAEQQPLDKIYFASEITKKTVAEIIRLAKKRGVPVRESSRRKLTELVGHEQHQGIVALISAVQYATLDDMLNRARQHHEKPVIVMLDEIQDPHNLGAIIRSADAFGLHGIILPKDRAAGLTDTVAKTSAGAVHHVAIARVTNLVQTLDQLKKDGFWIVGADQRSDKFITDIDTKLPLCIVIGSEGKGIRRLVKEQCDFLVRIPMFGRMNSLNASVAAAILFWEVRKKRESKK